MFLRDFESGRAPGAPDLADAFFSVRMGTGKFTPMRIQVTRMRIALAAASAAAFLALPGWAQKFQEPTQEELRMTSDPMAPGAPAVYLYFEEKTDNGAH